MRPAGRPPQRPTLRDVAQHAGVSIGTASRVINGTPGVCTELRQRVEQAIDRLHYTPNVFAQGMRGGASRTIGVLVRDITVPALAGFVRSAQQALHEAGYALLLACFDERRERELDFLSVVSGQRVDGLILTSISEFDADLVSARETLAVPTVLFDREVPATLDAIRIAHDRGVQDALEHLHRLGHRRIAIVTGGVDVHPGRSRLHGFREFHRSRGLTLDESLVRSRDFSADAAFMETASLLGLPDPPTAILAGGIGMLGGTLRAIRAAGLRVPDDLSVVGSGDSELAMLATPAISVVRWDYAEMGRTCTRLLLERLAGTQPAAPRRIVVDPELVLRTSCAPPPRRLG